MEKLGTNYGGWYVPKNMNLNEKSIVYSGGVGEDMSFDILLQNKYKCNILLIDPTERALKHYNEVLKYYIDKTNFTGNIQPDYLQYLKPIIGKLDFLNVGLWNCKDELKFFKQDNEKYVSQSLMNNMFGNKYDIVKVDTIKNIMENNNHNHIDLLKLDIEGAEINVLNNMFDDKIYPTYILIEFDLLIKRKDPDNRTNNLIKRMITIENYQIMKNDNLNITFIKIQ